ncbi:MAG: S1/P1 nuclease [Alistipes putredinis]
MELYGVAKPTRPPDRRGGARIQSGTPLDWFKESNAICREIYVATSEDSDLSYDYIATYAPVIERQLLRGGHRLAGLLNEIYG